MGTAAPIFMAATIERIDGLGSSNMVAFRTTWSSAIAAMSDAA
jgi:hypothetical protein